MKLLKVIIILSSLFVFSVNADGKDLKETEGVFLKMPDPIFLGDDLKYSMPLFFFRKTQFLRFSLSRVEKEQHKAAVFFMLNNTPNGVITAWHSAKRNLVNGQVRVIHSYPISGGYCRTYQAYIKVNGTQRHMTNNACKGITSIAWSFYK